MQFDDTAVWFATQLAAGATRYITKARSADVSSTAVYGAAWEASLYRAGIRATQLPCAYDGTLDPRGFKCMTPAEFEIYRHARQGQPFPAPLPAADANTARTCRIILHGLLKQETDVQLHDRTGSTWLSIPVSFVLQVL